MALTIKTEQAQAVLTRERTFEVRVHNKMGEVPRIVARREQVELKGEEIKRWLASTLAVSRDLPVVENETINLAGRQSDPITVGQLWATMETLLDRWAMEDRPQLAQEVAAASAPEASP